MSRRGLLAVLVALIVAGGCSPGGDGPGGDGGSGRAGRATTTTTVAPQRGGAARVGVWGEPDPAAPTLGGAAVRALVLPQLFVAGPDGRWRPSLVEGGSDVTAPDRRSARLRLRPGRWSDGTAVTADDLRRTADARFVAGIDGPGPDGTLTVRFTQPLPGWRRLWSATDSVAAPAPGVWGGPFVVESYQPGLEVVLRRHDGWYGGPGPFLDELRLVLVPDATMARRLLAAGELDALMPPADTVRTPQLEALDDVAVDVGDRSGWWVGLRFAPARLAPDRRRAVAATVDRRLFVETLLAGEATELPGFVRAADGEETGPWAEVAAGDAAALAGATVDLVGQFEEPLRPLLQRSMQRRAVEAGGRLDLRNAEAERVEPWVAAGEFEAALTMEFDSPVVCWTCRWASVDEDRARAADAGDRAAAEALQARLAGEVVVVPLWRPTPVVAWRRDLAGPGANGYALSAAWNAWEWHRPAG